MARSGAPSEFSAARPRWFGSIPGPTRPYGARRNLPCAAAGLRHPRRRYRPQGRRVGVAVERASRQLRPAQVQGPAQRTEGDRRSLSGGLVVLPVPGSGLRGIGENSAESSYYTWVDQHNTFGLGEDVPMSTANLTDGLVAFKDGKMILLRVPYPLGFYAKGFDGRIDDPKAGWKGRGLWTTSGDRTPWLPGGGKGASRRPCTSNSAPIHWPSSFMVGPRSPLTEASRTWWCHPCRSLPSTKRVSPIPQKRSSRVPKVATGAVSTRKAGRVRTTSSADDSAARQGGLPVGSVALVSILCPDRVGVVAAIADYLFDVGVNLRDTSFGDAGHRCGVHIHL